MCQENALHRVFVALTVLYSPASRCKRYCVNAVLTSVKWRLSYGVFSISDNGEPTRVSYVFVWNAVLASCINSTLRYECDETLSWRVWLHHSPSARAANSHSSENVFRTRIVRNFISRGVKMRISAREACVSPPFHTRSEIKYTIFNICVFTKYKNNGSRYTNEFLYLIISQEVTSIWV